MSSQFSNMSQQQIPGESLLGQYPYAPTSPTLQIPSADFGELSQRTLPSATCLSPPAPPAVMAQQCSPRSVTSSYHNSQLLTSLPPRLSTTSLPGNNQIPPDCIPLTGIKPLRPNYLSKAHTDNLSGIVSSGEVSNLQNTAVGLHSSDISKINVALTKNGPYPLPGVSYSAPNAIYSNTVINSQDNINGTSNVLHCSVQNGPSYSVNSGNALLSPNITGALPFSSDVNAVLSPGPRHMNVKQQNPVAVSSTSQPCVHPLLPTMHPSFQPTADVQPVPTQTSVPSTSASLAQVPLLPPPFIGQKCNSTSPLATPGTSEPPSARSSRNPSPIPAQRIDFMEGQFPSNKPSPSNSTTNLHQCTAGVGQIPQIRPPVVTQSTHSLSGLSSNFHSIGSFSASMTPVFTSMQSQIAVQTVAPSSTGSMSTRARYSNQVGYIQPQVTSQSCVSQLPSMRVQHYPSPVLPDGPVGGVPGYDPNLHAKMAGMSINSSFSRLWGNDSINLLQDRNILPSKIIEPPKPVLPQEKPNCSPDIFRCTLTKVPESNSLLQKSRLPLGILIHPFRDVSHLPVIQCVTIVRCRSCRTYINPFVSFVDQRRWKCNLCFRINDLPEEFLYDPVTRTYGDPSRRPEIRNATIEFIAPSDYMLRPPQPAVYLFLLDVSHGATETGYLLSFCKILLAELDYLPGDARTQIGFITFDGSVHFYNLGEGLNQPHMLIVSDTEDVFLPSPDSLLVNLHECKPLIKDLLCDLPKRFATNGDTNSALGAALQAAYKLLAPTGGRVTVMQTCLPNVDPGALKIREDPNQRAAKIVNNLGPANDFYKKLALDCSGQQIAVDLFLLSSQYVDIATISCIAKYSAGCVYYYPGFHAKHAKIQVERYENDLQRYLTRKIGFEAVMRIRCTRGLSIHTFHGNFFVRSTDLLSLPNVNPDAGFGMQIAIEENLNECNAVCFQAAVLYTSSKGERRIRVHTLSLPVASLLADVLGGADQQAVIGLVAKMAVDRSLSSSLSDARDALINVCLDMLGIFKQTLPSSQTASALMAPYSTRLIPLFILSLLKHVAFRIGICTKLDERVFAMEQMKTVPLSYLLTYIYPNMYPVHALDDENAIHHEDKVIPQPPILQLTFEKIDRHGAYLLDTLDTMFLYVGRAVSDHFCMNIFGVPNFSAIPENMINVPELHTPESERLRFFIEWCLSHRPFYAPVLVIREDNKERHRFLQYMVDDRTESLFSYYEFLQHLKQQISK